MYWGIEDYKDFRENRLVDITEHIGYKKLQDILEKTDLSVEQKNLVKLQYHFLIGDTTQGILKGEVETYIINNYPEIVTFLDIVNEKTPYIKCMWTFHKEDEELVDKCINILQYDKCKKHTLRYLDNDILVVIINIRVDCVWDKEVDNRKKDEAREFAYELFEQLKSRMIKHGMCWYMYANSEHSFSASCEFFPVRSLAIKEIDDGWAKDGYRKDLDHAFRSAWEANIARLLNYKNIKWKYEPYFVNLKSPSYIKGNKLINYLPDFELEDKTIIEVKGFWDNRSKLNVSQFMQQHPEEKYLVIDTDIYRCINQKYKDIIPYWEQDNVEFSNDEIQVVGIALPQRKAFVSRIKVGDELELIREPQNEYDTRAIRVNDLEGNQVGYFAMDCNCIYAPKMDMGFRYKLQVVAKESKLLRCKIKLVNTKDIIIPDIFL